MGHNGLLSILGMRPPSLLTPPFVGRRGILQHRPWTRKHYTLHSTSTQPTGAAYVSGVLRASRRTRVDFDCTRTQGTCRTLRHVVSKRRRETASRNAQQSTRKYTCTRCAHGTSQRLQVRTIHPRPGNCCSQKTANRNPDCFSCYRRNLYLPFFGCGSLAKCTAGSYFSHLRQHFCE